MSPQVTGGDYNCAVFVNSTSLSGHVVFKIYFTHELFNFAISTLVVLLGSVADTRRTTTPSASFPRAKLVTAGVGYN